MPTTKQKEKLYTIDEMRLAFNAGRKSVEPKLKFERWGDMEPYADIEVVSNFKQFIHHTYKNDGRRK